MWCGKNKLCYDKNILSVCLIASLSATFVIAIKTSSKISERRLHFASRIVFWKEYSFPVMLNEQSHHCWWQPAFDYVHNTTVTDGHNSCDNLSDYHYQHEAWRKINTIFECNRTLCEFCVIDSWASCIHNNYCSCLAAMAITRNCGVWKSVNCNHSVGAQSVDVRSHSPSAKDRRRRRTGCRPGEQLIQCKMTSITFSCIHIKSLAILVDSGQML